MTESRDGLKKHWRVFYGLDGITITNTTMTTTITATTVTKITQKFRILKN